MKKKTQSTKSERKPTGFKIPRLTSEEFQAALREHQVKEYQEGQRMKKKGAELNKKDK